MAVASRRGLRRINKQGEGATAQQGESAAAAQVARQQE